MMRDMQTRLVYNKGYLVLPIEPLDIPPTIDILGTSLQAKTSFHISLLAVKNYIQKYGPDIEEKILTIVDEFTRDHSFSVLAYKNEFRFAQVDADQRKSLVVMVEIEYLSNFFETLRKKLSVDIEDQPTHCTLYTFGLDRGIGINNQHDLQTLTHIVDSEVPNEVKEVFGF